MNSISPAIALPGHRSALAFTRLTVCALIVPDRADGQDIRILGHRVVPSFMPDGL